MTFTDELTRRAADVVGRRTSRRGFLGRTAVVGSALAVAGRTYVLRPGTAYAAVTRVTCSDCGGGLCCDGYTEFCCHLSDDGANECPPGTLLAGWWKVDNSDFCFGTARYYMDCNRESPDCDCGSSGACQDDASQCGCRDCDSRKDSCTVFRYGNCNNDISCVGPIVCRVVTCTKPWEIEPSCTQVPRTDERTRNHHRPCLERDPDDEEVAFVQALYEDFLGRSSDPSGEAHWADMLAKGSHLGQRIREMVAENFAYSDEYATSVTESLYEKLLDRQPDPDGAAFWSDALRDGSLTPEDLAVELLASEEFFNQSASDRREFVRHLYRRTTEREATDEEVAHHVASLESGDTRRSVAAEVYASEDSRAVRVEALYERFLGRSAEPDGRAWWIAVLEDHPDITLAVFLAASDEYHARAQTRAEVAA